MAHRNDRRPGVVPDATPEQMTQAAEVLALVAKRYQDETPGAPVDEFEFVMRVGADAYTVAGRSSAGGHRQVAALVRERAPQLAGATRGWLAEGLLATARRMGWEDDAETPAIPSHPVPRPRTSDESGRVPAPRPEQAVGR
ncbi:hypothetical protein ACIQTN_29760 [Streptomyces werraensis]|uniref:hypothetical protein n=1 Tax=Streptomyces werraensis TaxID=68284 RepID=UPI003804CB78